MGKVVISKEYAFSSDDDELIELVRQELLKSTESKYLHKAWTQYCRNKEIELFYDAIDTQDNILEIGSGDGYVAYVLNKNNGLSIVASDMEPRYPQYLEVRKIDGQSTGLEQHLFDMLISVHVLEHIEDIDLAMKEFTRLLKSGGTMCHVVPSSSNMVLTTLIQPFAYFRNICLYFNGYHIKRNRPFKNKNVLRFLWGLIRTTNPVNFFWGAGHGIYNRINCIHYWKVNKWIEVFERNGFEVQKVEKSSISYSMHKVFPFRFIRVRNFLTKLGFSSAHLFVVKKK